MVQEAQTMEIITLPAIIQILPEIHPKTAVLSPNLRNPDMRIIRLMNRRRSPVSYTHLDVYKRQAVYTDEDKVTAELDEHFQPHLKPDFNIDLLRSNN